MTMIYFQKKNNFCVRMQKKNVENYLCATEKCEEENLTIKRKRNHHHDRHQASLSDINL